jgi:hypothetical protein
MESKIPVVGSDRLDSRIYLMEVDCKNNTTMGIKMVFYDDEGGIIKNFDIQNPAIIHTLPETRHEILLRKVCPQ